MTFSINTNYSALVALQNLTTIQEKLEVSRNRVSTGLRVQTAADDAAAYRGAEILKGTNAVLGGNVETMNRVSTALKLTLTTTGQITDLLNQLREKSVQYQSPLSTAEMRTFLQNQSTVLIRQIDGLVAGAKYLNLNLVNNSTAVEVKLNGRDAATTNALTMTLVTANLNTTGLAISGTTLSNVANATTMVSKVDAALVAVNKTAAGFAGVLGAMQALSTATKAQIENNKAGISQLVDADLQAESSAIQALQIQQQLAAQAMTIANANPQVLLRLFKN